LANNPPLKIVLMVGYPMVVPMAGYTMVVPMVGFPWRREGCLNEGLSLPIKAKDTRTLFIVGVL
jgi:hypothetical protein